MKTVDEHTAFVRNKLAYFIERHGMSLKKSDVGSMGDWYIVLHATELMIAIIHERNGFEYLEIGAKIHSHPRGRANSWPLGHIRGYLDGGKDHYLFRNLDEQIEWLKDHEKTVLNVSFINSKKLSRWPVDAARRAFR